MKSINECLKGTNCTVEEFLGECYLDYVFFAEHVLDFEIAEYHREWYRLAEKYGRLCIEAFRGSGKTYFFSGYFLWKAIFQGPRETLIVSFREGQAKKVLKIVRNMILDNEFLKQFAPDSREQIWRATELELNNGSLFLCKPYNEGIRTWHPDDILLDEIGEYEDKSIYWTAVLGAIHVKMGRVIAIGTPKSGSDLLAELKVNDEYFFKEYPVEKNGKVLWPQRYTLLNYDTATQSSIPKIKRDLGELPFMQEYMLIPLSSANSLFPIELTHEALADKEGFLPFGRKDERYYIGYDIARTPKGDYTVMIVLGVNADGIRLVKGLRFRDTFEEQLKKFRKLYQDFRPIKCCVDGTGIGDQQSRDIEREFPGVEIIKFTYEIKLNMLTDLRREFENLNISLPNAKDVAYAFTQQLIKELSEIALKTDLRIGQTTRQKFHSGKYDDCAISLALANRASQNIYGAVSVRGI